jgi:hypothetical protein
MQRSKEGAIAVGDEVMVEVRSGSVRETKRPPGNSGGLFLQGRIVPAEAKPAVRTCWENSIDDGRGVSRNFSEPIYLFSTV